MQRRGERGIQAHVSSALRPARLPRLALLPLAAALIACGPDSATSEPASEQAAREASRSEDPRAADWLVALSADSAAAARGAVREIVAARDTRFVAVFIELLRAAEVGIAGDAVRRDSATALEALTDQSFGTDWPAWVEWYAGTELEPPPGFTGWKGDLLGRVDENFSRLLYPGAPSRIRVEEVLWGGVAYQGIPALDRPDAIPAGKADYLEPGEPVFGIALNGEARAYPHRILDWHEMVNDELGGVHFSLAYCTLCGSGIAYRGEASDGRVYDFGSSGFLMRSNKLMVDRQTESLWNQFTGRPVLGRLAASEIRLERLPGVVATWAAWKARHPETTVLSLETGHNRPYQPGAAYGGYFASPDTMFPVRSHGGPPRKTRVYGLEVEGIPVAYPVDLLTRIRLVRDEIGGKPVLLLASAQPIEVEALSLRSGRVHYSAGAEVRAYRTSGQRFELAEEDDLLRDEAGRRWRVSEDALIGPAGQRLERLPGVQAYWFAWSAYHPKTRLFSEQGPGAVAPQAVR